MVQVSRALVAFPKVPAPTLGGSKLLVTSYPMEFSSDLWIITQREEGGNR